MCAVFGYLDYKGKVNNVILKKLIRNLSIAAEGRGTDATGISYVNHGKVVTFKKAKPAHKVKLYFPKSNPVFRGKTLERIVHIQQTQQLQHESLECKIRFRENRKANFRESEEWLQWQICCSQSEQLPHNRVSLVSRHAQIQYFHRHIADGQPHLRCGNFFL